MSDKASNDMADDLESEWLLIVLGQAAPAYHLPPERLNLPIIISPLSTLKRIRLMITSGVFGQCRGCVTPVMARANNGLNGALSAPTA